MGTPDLPDAFLAADDPAKANAAASSLESAAMTPYPESPEIVPDFITLPCGLVKGEERINSAIVRELNGDHEEQLARAAKAQPPNYYHYLNTLLECGVKQIGSADPDATKKLLKDLCAGDRDFLVIAIRRVTYGDEISFVNFPCMLCGEEADIKIDLDKDIEVEKRQPEDLNFEVKLRNNRTARCRTPNGHDQEALGALNPKTTTPAESNTVLIQQCVVEIVDNKTGRAQFMAAFPRLARDLGMSDRREIIKALQRQPGPKYNDVKYTCPNCDQEVSLAVEVGALFLV